MWMTNLPSQWHITNLCQNIIESMAGAFAEYCSQLVVSWAKKARDFFYFKPLPSSITFKKIRLVIASKGIQMNESKRLLNTAVCSSHWTCRFLKKIFLHLRLQNKKSLRQKFLISFIGFMVGVDIGKLWGIIVPFLRCPHVDSWGRVLGYLKACLCPDQPCGWSNKNHQPQELLYVSGTIIETASPPRYKPPPPKKKNKPYFFCFSEKGKCIWSPTNLQKSKNGGEWHWLALLSKVDQHCPTQPEIQMKKPQHLLGVSLDKERFSCYLPGTRHHGNKTIWKQKILTLSTWRSSKISHLASKIQIIWIPLDLSFWDYWKDNTQQLDAWVSSHVNHL